MPTMPHDQAEADQLASPHLDGANDRAAFGAAALCRVQRLSCGALMTLSASRWGAAAEAYWGVPGIRFIVLGLMLREPRRLGLLFLERG